MLLTVALFLQQADRVEAPPTAPLPTAALAEVSEPSAEALALGEQVARNGVLAALLPRMTAGEAEQMVATNPSLPADEVARLRAVAAATALEATNRIFMTEGRAYAAALSIDDLRALAAHARSGVAQRARAAMPSVIAATVAALDGYDFKGTVRERFCATLAEPCALIASD